MTRFLTKLGVTTALAAFGLTSALQANAALFSSTEMELLDGDYEERGDEKQGILTIANASGFKVHVQYRDDPQLDDESVQLNLVWNAPFNIGGAKFSFVVTKAAQIHQQTVVNKAMPIGKLTQITDEERGLIDQWFRAGAKASKRS